jgi:hypothetical protein
LNRFRVARSAGDPSLEPPLLNGAVISYKLSQSIQLPSQVHGFTSLRVLAVWELADAPVILVDVFKHLEEINEAANPDIIEGDDLHDTM